MTEKIIPMYSGKPEDFHWVGFGSGSGTNLRECSRIIKPVLIFSDRPKAKLLGLEELADVPKIVINGYRACGSWKKAVGNPELEAKYEEKSAAYNQQVLDKLQEFEKQQGISIDLIVLGGYMRLLKEPLLSAFKDRIINVHPANLSITRGAERTYIGEDAVYDAIKACETRTKSSVIMVDDGEDHGEILTQGPELKVWPEFLRGTDAEREECLREYADAHQSFQKVRSDWPALTSALKMISEGRIALGTEKTHFDEWRAVYVDGKPVGYEGFQVVEDVKRT
jgi:folate-dependent phosphoribosylglycinamide formyltransferase PurN